jgi:hypothetical protein
VSGSLAAPEPPFQRQQYAGAGPGPEGAEIRTRLHSAGRHTRTRRTLRSNPHVQALRQDEAKLTAAAAKLSELAAARRSRESAGSCPHYVGRVGQPVTTQPRPAGRAPRLPTNGRTRGSRRGAATSSRSSTDDDSSGGEPPDIDRLPSRGADSPCADETVRECEGLLIAGTERRRPCGKPIHKPRRGPWPELCPDCKREKDADRKREESHERQLERNAWQTHPPRGRHEGRVPGVYRNSDGRELFSPSIGGEDGVVDFIFSYGAGEGLGLRPEAHILPPDCRGDFEEWNPMREAYAAGSSDVEAKRLRDERIRQARAERLAETEERMRKWARSSGPRSTAGRRNDERRRMTGRGREDQDVAVNRQWRPTSVDELPVAA